MQNFQTTRERKEEQMPMPYQVCNTCYMFELQKQYTVLKDSCKENTPCMIPLISNVLEKANLQREMQINCCLELEWEQRLSTDGHEESLLGDGTILRLDCGNGCPVNSVNLLKIFTFTL